MKVKMLESGACEGYFFEKGQVMDLPDNVVAALSKNSYESLEVPETKQQVKRSTKQVTDHDNK